MPATFTTTLPDEDPPALDNDVDGEISVDRETQTTNNGDIRIQAREIGSSTWDNTANGWAEQVVTYDTLTTNLTISGGLLSHEVRLRAETEHVTGAWTTPVALYLLTATSYASASTSSADRALELDERGTASHSNPFVSSVVRTFQNEPINVTSHALPASSSSSRGSISVERSTMSHMAPASTAIYNDRTSLELLDYDLTWDEDEVAWYTEWSQESRITGREDLFAVRALVVPMAKKPAATILVQYSEDGSTVAQESDPIDTYDDELVNHVPELPVNPDGYYRMKITNYSGYNELYSLDMGFIHK
ncbi:hypothetical protein [Halomonas sp.]|uniref:hypothetical protein n=1 Tax=Halomonas sp. TaxID=1486246 RepID=UPI003568F38C